MTLYSKEKTLRELKEFGEVMALACLVCSGVGLYKAKAVTVPVSVFLSIAAIFLVLAFCSPELLRPIEKKWLAFSERLSVVMTFLVLTVTFVFLVTPLGVALRLFGKDLLQLKIDKKSDSYWDKVDPAGPGSRHYLPY